MSTTMGLEARVRDAIARVDDGELIELLAELVRTPSVYDPGRPDGNEAAVADLVCARLGAWGLDYVRWDVAPGRPNIVVNIAGGPGPVLVFEGHMDVVTPGDPALWERDPFGAEIVDCRMYGRGTADMKGGLAAMLAAARALGESGRNFRGTVRLAILSDEEGMMRGARSFVERGWLDDAAAAIICEPEGGRVCTAQKGALRFAAHFCGKMSHGCMPDEGVNPVAALGAAIVACRELEAEIIAEHPLHPLLGRFSISPTVVHGGVAEQANVIPARATLYLDVRTCPEHDHDLIAARIREACGIAAAGVEGVTLDFEVIDDRPATETPEGEPVVAAARAAHELVFGTEPPTGGVPGSTDGTIFWMARRTPLVTWGPGETTIPHQANEFVRLDEVCAYARAYVAAALHFFDQAGERP